MNKLKPLIKRDLLFSIKLLPVFLICAIALPVYGGRFAENIFANPLIVLSITSILAVLIYLSAICYLEDNTETEGFLSSMPLSKTDRVFARYAVALILMITAFAISLVSFAVAGGALTVSDVIWAASIVVVHYAVFLYIFYKSGLQTAQYVPATLILAGAVALKTGAVTDFGLPAGGYEYGAFLVAAIVFVFAAKYSAEE